MCFLLFLIYFIYIYRFLETATVLEKNLSLFQFFCEHVDIITTIIEYLKYYGTKFAIKKLDMLGR